MTSSPSGTNGTDELQALARAVALHLRRQQLAYDTRYVRVRAAPAPAVPAQAHASSPPRQDPAARTKTAAAPRPAAGKLVDSKAALRSQAENWSAATKLEYLRKKNLGDCRRCGLCQTRKNIVFGVGNAQARVMFVGEAPGADEDRKGEPFVGRAGQLLDRWVADLGMSRGDVYIANVLKCRPPGNRDPRPEEVDKCSPFLRAQIRAIRPAVVIGLGRHAGMLLSRRDDMSLGAMRGARLEYDASSPKEAARSLVIPLVVTYHPAYVLRQSGDAEDKATQMVMTDLRRALDLVNRS